MFIKECPRDQHGWKGLVESTCGQREKSSCDADLTNLHQGSGSKMALRVFFRWAEMARLSEIA